MCGKAQRVTRLVQLRLQKPRSYWTKFQQILNTLRGIIGGVKAYIRVAILPSTVELQHTEWRWGMLIFADLRQKLVTIATSLLSDGVKQVMLI